MNHHPDLQKGDKCDCKNHKSISLASVLDKCLQRYCKDAWRFVGNKRAFAEEQADIRPKRGTTELIFTYRQITEKLLEHSKPCYFNSMDFKQAFDSILQEGLWQCLRMHRHRRSLCDLLRASTTSLQQVWDSTANWQKGPGQQWDWGRAVHGPQTCSTWCWSRWWEQGSRIETV